MCREAGFHGPEPVGQLCGDERPSLRRTASGGLRVEDDYGLAWLTQWKGLLRQFGMSPAQIIDRIAESIHRITGLKAKFGPGFGRIAIPEERRHADRFVVELELLTNQR